MAVLASRILGVVRESLLAAAFGRRLADRRLRVAFRIPNLLRDLFAEGALSSAFVPTFTEALANGGRERAYPLANLVLSGLLLVTGALTLLGIVFAGPVVSSSRGVRRQRRQAARGHPAGPGDDAHPAAGERQRRLDGDAERPAALHGAAYAPALFNVTSIVCGLGSCWRPGSSRAGDPAVEREHHPGRAGAGAGAAAQPVAAGYRPAWPCAGLWRDPDVRRIVRLMGPAVVGLAAVNVNVFVNTQFASKLGDGPVATSTSPSASFTCPSASSGWRWPR